MTYVLVVDDEICSKGKLSELREEKPGWDFSHVIQKVICGIGLMGIDPINTDEISWVFPLWENGKAAGHTRLHLLFIMSAHQTQRMINTSSTYLSGSSIVGKGCAPTGKLLMRLSTSRGSSYPPRLCFRGLRLVFFWNENVIEWNTIMIMHHHRIQIKWEQSAMSHIT